MDNKRKENVNVFDRDVINNDGYIYTRSARISTQLSNDRMTRGIAQIVDFKGKTVLDLGCGDGTFTFKLIELGAKHVVGIDPAGQAIENAKNRAKKKQIHNVRFEVDNIYDMGERAERYDLVVLRGVLHHLPNAASAIAISVKLGKEIVILEPNGSNPVLKIIEKISPYHIQHEEQSFRLKTMRKWLNDAGAKILQYQYINFVPIFCPDPLARALKTLEPAVESIAGIRALCCGQYVIRAGKK